MPSFDYKHLIAGVVGIALGLLGTKFGIDFSKSCPAVPSAQILVLPSSTPAVAK